MNSLPQGWCAKGFLVGSGLLLWPLLESVWALPSAAQIAPDTTLGTESSVVAPNATVNGNPVELIEGGAQRGYNLYHSFADFNVGALQPVYFAQPIGILDIYGRVTGGNISNIDGLLGVDGSANLYLLNPNGVIFGPNAQLDIAGSLTVSTADRFFFSDDNSFSATNPNAAPLLQITATPGLQYGSQPAAITNEGNLQVGQTLTLSAQRLELAGSLEVGRDIVLQGAERLLSEADYTVGGYLFTRDLSGAGLEMVIPHENAILAEGDVQLNDLYFGPSLYILAGGQVTSTRDINITNGASGSFTQELTDGLEGTQLVTVTATDQPTVDIRSGVNFVDLLTTSLEESNTSGISITNAETTGQSIVLDDVFNDGGVVYLNASEDITVAQVNTSIFLSEVDAMGNVTGVDGGPISLIAGRDILEPRLFSGFSTPFSFSSGPIETVIGGNGGSLFLSAGRDIVNLRAAAAESYVSLDNDVAEVFGGNGGAISLVAGRNINGNREVSNEFSLLYSGSWSQSREGNTTGGNGGSIIVVAGNDISDLDARTDSFAESANVAGGNGGAISLSSGGDIFYSDAYQDSFFFNPIPTVFDSSSVSTSNSGVSTSGNGGAISLSASGDILGNEFSARLTAGSAALVTSSGDATSRSGGSIAFSAGRDISRWLLLSGSSAETELGNATAGSGGNIRLDAGRNVANSSLYSSSFAVLAPEDPFGVSVSESSSTEGNNALQFFSAITGNGGDVTLIAETGEIDGVGGETVSISESGIPDAIQSTSLGGRVTLQAFTIIRDSDVLTASSLSSSGVVDIVGLGESLDILNTNVTTGKTTEVTDPDLFEPIILPAGQQGQAGDIRVRLLEESNLLTFSNTNFLGTSNGTDPAGNITITSPEQIFFFNSNILSEAENIGAAGSIFLDAPKITIDENSQISTSTTDVGAAGDINVNTATLTLINGGELLSQTSGSGNSGNVTINATESVNLGEGVQDSAPVISVETSGAGKPGNILISTPNFTLSDTARITATATETATNLDGGGSITLSANTLDLAGTVGIFAETQSQAPGGFLTLQPYQTNPALTATFQAGSVISASTSSSGRGGNLQIQAPESIFLSGPGRLAVETSSEGDAGDIAVTTQDLTLTNGVTLSALTNGSGAAGDINIDTATLNLTNGAQILSPTDSSGAGGSVAITATESVNLGEGVQDFFPIISVEASGAGQPGNIAISTPNFILSETAQITATATDTATNLANGGSITLSANALDLAGIVGIFAETQGQSPGGVLTLQPYLNNPSLVAAFQSGSEISASTSGSGPGGNLQVSAPESILLSGPGRLAVETSGPGEAGGIAVTTGQLTLTDGVTLSASTSSTSPDAGAAGSITLTADDLTIQNGAQVITNTAGSGNAGNIKLTVSDILDIDNATVAARTEVGSTGLGGDIDIDPTLTMIRNGGRVEVNSDGAGQGGNIALISDHLLLDRGFIEAQTATSDGGNILLDIRDLILLNNGSLISATAGTGQGDGNGGNITIDLSDGFLVGALGSDSDIVARAFVGTGGNINITARGIYGLVERPAIRGNGSNDIDASSQFGQSGTITINDPVVDPSSANVELPADVINAADLVDRRCQADIGENQSSLIVTGRGGLPPDPSEIVRSDESALTDLAFDDAVSETTSSAINHPAESPATDSPEVFEQVVEAQTWERNEAGQVVLMANQNSASSPDSLTAATCQTN